MTKQANQYARLAGLLVIIAAAAGCGSSPSQPDENKMHQILSGPPSLEGMKNARPRGAKQPAGNLPGQPGGAAPGGAPAATAGG